MNNIYYRAWVWHAVSHFVNPVTICVTRTRVGSIYAFPDHDETGIYQLGGYLTKSARFVGRVKLH